jgi:hypothetical protein
MLTPRCETAPFCADPQRHDWLQTLVKRSTDFLLHQVGPQNIDAIILTGSTARGEASVLPIAADYRLLGDLEFLVIVRAPFDWPAMRRRMHELSCQATRDIGAEGYHASIEYGPAGRIYLQRNIRPSIFAYDLRTHGRVLWQQVDIWPDMCPVSVEEIPREDALNLLMNRLVELLMLDARGGCTEPRAMQDQAYHLVKVMLDLAGSALAFAGRHVSRYSERSRDFRDLLDTSPDLCAALRDVDHFVATLEQAVACKLDPTDIRLALPDPAAATRQHTVWSLDLWLWEVQHLLGLPATTFRHTLEAYLARETLKARLKGWGKFLRHPLRPAHALSWPRLLRHLFRTSPQTLTYAAALLTQAGMAGVAGPDWRQQVAVVSPVPLSPAHNGRVAQDIGALWQWLLRNN